MNIKKEAYEKLIKKLDEELKEIYFTLNYNTGQINRLSDKQRELKIQRNELMTLINILRNKEK